MSKYRLLTHHDKIQKGDEYLDDDATTWIPLSGALIGLPYGCGLKPARRPIEEEPAPDQKGLPVRIAVAVDPETLEWNSAGWKGAHSDPSDETKMDTAVEMISKNEQCYWIEAVIPITDPPVIVGTVTEGE